MACTFLEEPERTRALTDECLRVIHGRGFHSVECSARVQAGWARTRLGDPAGLQGVREGLELARTSGAGGGLAQLYFIAAETCKLAGRFDEALSMLEAGRRTLERTGERMGYEPQVAATRARLLLAQEGDPEEVERLLLEAFAGWGRSEAPWLRLESAVLLARVAARTGRRVEAHERLAGVLAGFKEGFETRRLREARALLDAAV
jgi:hypothetical protein